MAQFKDPDLCWQLNPVFCKIGSKSRQYMDARSANLRCWRDPLGPSAVGFAENYAKQDIEAVTLSDGPRVICNLQDGAQCLTTDK